MFTSSILDYYRERGLSGLNSKPLNSMLTYSDDPSVLIQDIDNSPAANAIKTMTGPQQAQKPLNAGSALPGLAVGIGTGALETLLASKRVKPTSTGGQWAGATEGAAQGAVAGTSVMPGWGTLIGGIIGAGLGLAGRRR